MPKATPDVGECAICMEVEPSVKMLDCDHQLCLPCAKRLIKDATDGNHTLLVCPQCRRQTDYSQGLADLRTLYFGKILCDVCLDRKDSSDMWWCRSCFKALCSKCSINEHKDKKKHALSEWNKMEAVQFSVNYINKIEYSRQISTSDNRNTEMINCFLKDVEAKFHEKLQFQPDTVNLKSNLLARYGNRFSSSDSSLDGQSPAPPSSAPRTIAKVLQLAGADIQDAAIPNLTNQHYELKLYVTPEEVAQFLRSKTEFVAVAKPPDVAAAPTCSEQTASSSSTAAAAPDAGTVNQALSVAVDEQEISRIGGAQVVLQVDYNSEANVVAVRTSMEVQLYNFTTQQCNSVPIAPKMNVRSVTFGDGSELLMCLQSVEKRYSWTLEAFDFAQQPVSLVYSAPFDIDPEDKVDEMNIRVTGEPGAIYELRQCQEDVSEIWKAQTQTKKKGKVKLQEKLIYQRAQSRFTSLRVLLGGAASKERFLFVWDELSACVYRLIVKDLKCEIVTKVIHSPELIPFCCDAERRLVFFDTHTRVLCRSAGEVTNRVNVTFSPVAVYNRLTVRSVNVRKTTPDVVCVAVSPTHVVRVAFLSAAAVAP